jgi:hypothetical protein
MIGHDIVKQLREMEQKAAKNFRKNEIEPEKLEILCDGPEDCVDVAAKVLCFANRNAGEYIEHDTANLIIEMRNNADLLLSIAEAFQPGDAEQLASIARYFEERDGSIERAWALQLRRLQAAAARLER